MNARDALGTAFDDGPYGNDTKWFILDNLRQALGWDGTGTPPDIAITSDGQLKRLEEEIAPEGVIEGPAPVYRLVDPDNMEDRP